MHPPQKSGFTENPRDLLSEDEEEVVFPSPSTKEREGTAPASGLAGLKFPSTISTPPGTQLNTPPPKRKRESKEESAFSRAMRLSREEAHRKSQAPVPAPVLHEGQLKGESEMDFVKRISKLQAKEDEQRQMKAAFGSEGGMLDYKLSSGESGGEEAAEDDDEDTQLAVEWQDVEGEDDLVADDAAPVAASYRLQAVVHHLGKYAFAGHYIADVVRKRSPAAAASASVAHAGSPAGAPSAADMEATFFKRAAGGEGGKSSDASSSTQSGSTQSCAAAGSATAVTTGGSGAGAGAAALGELQFLRFDDSSVKEVRDTARDRCVRKMWCVYL